MPSTLPYGGSGVNRRLNGPASNAATSSSSNLLNHIRSLHKMNIHA